MKRDYGEISRFWLEKNKPNSKPIAGLWPEILNKLIGCGMTESKAHLNEHD